MWIYLQALCANKIRRQYSMEYCDTEEIKAITSTVSFVNKLHKILL